MFRTALFGSRMLSASMLVASILAASAATLFAASNTVSVPSTADIWLAGQPNTTVLQGVYASFDVAPANSPVLASTGLNLTAGSYLTFAASGVTSYSTCTGASPDGGGGCGTYTTASYFGISTYRGPVNSLVGVFVNSNVPGGTAPSGLDFTTSGSQSQSTISPALNQVLFIGDGVTGTGSGSVQHFVVPAGATRLVLGSADGAGANYDNPANLAFSVTISDAPTAAPGVSTAVSTPAVSAIVLIAMALLLMGSGAYYLKGRAT